VPPVTNTEAPDRSGTGLEKLRSTKWDMFKTAAELNPGKGITGNPGADYRLDD
jgi:hypothetical protein